MAKIYTDFGYAETKETALDVYSEEISERKHYAQILRSASRWQTGENLNDNLTLDVQMSIIADSFANENFHALRYVNWRGANWEVTKVEPRPPRLILTIGGVYNGKKRQT